AGKSTGTCELRRQEYVDRCARRNTWKRNGRPQAGRYLRGLERQVVALDGVPREVPGAKRQLLVRLDEDPDVPGDAEVRSADLEIGEIGSQRHAELRERDARRELLRRQVGALIQLECRGDEVRSAANENLIADLVCDRRLKVRRIQYRLVRDEAPGEF